MNRDVSHILLLLASSDLTNSQIRQFCKWLDRNGPSALENGVASIRRSAEDAALDPSTGSEMVSTSREREGAQVQLPLNVTDPDAARRVEALLRRGTGLSAREAADALSEALTKRGEVDLPPFSESDKKGFLTWIRRLSTKVQLSVLLHEAARIRDGRLGTPERQWPLRSRE